MAEDSGGMHIVNLMRRMHSIEEERKDLLQELSAWGSPVLGQARREHWSGEGTEEHHDLVALWTETSEMMQGIIVEKEALLEVARARSVSLNTVRPNAYSHLPRLTTPTITGWTTWSNQDQASR